MAACTEDPDEVQSVMKIQAKCFRAIKTVLRTLRGGQKAGEILINSILARENWRGIRVSVS